MYTVLTQREIIVIALYNCVTRRGIIGIIIVYIILCIAKVDNKTSLRTMTSN